MKKVFGYLALLVVGLVLTCTGYSDWQNSKRLVAEGKSTVARVTDHHTERGRRGSRRYYLVVAFETESQQAQTYNIRVSSDVYSKATASGSVRVHYLANNPGVVQAGEKAETKYANLVLGLLFLVFSLGTVAFYVGAALLHRSSAKKLGAGVVAANQSNVPPVVNQGSQTIASLPAKDNGENYQKAA